MRLFLLGLAGGLERTEIRISTLVAGFRRMVTVGLVSLVGGLVATPLVVTAQADRVGSGKTVESVKAEYGKLPLSFEANVGQSDRAVKFLSRGNGYSLFLTDSGAVLSLAKAEVTRTKPTSEKPDVGHPDYRTDVVRMELVGASKGLLVGGAETLPGVANYFLGNDPAKWRADVPTYARVKYFGVYPGIDLVYYGNQRQLEYDFVVGAHADPNRVRVQFAGVHKLRVGAEGDLMVAAKHGEVVFHKPVVYQVVDGKRTLVDGDFKLMANNEVGFRLGKYDAGRELVIDPTLVYSTYLGGSGSYAGDFGNAIAVDSAGNAYVTGSTGSTNFPVLNPYQKSLVVIAGRQVTPMNAFVTKINPTGTGLVYSTYLGGSDDYRFGDAGRGIAVDGTGAAYVAGTTGSTDFPITSSAYQKTNKTVAASGSFTGFVTKLSPAGNTLSYSTFLGGSGVANCCNVPYGDAAVAIALDPANEAVITGYTSSKDFPVLNAIQKVDNSTVKDYYGQASGYNAFVTKLNAAGSGLIYSTYLGGTGQDAASGVAVDGQGSAYIVGTAGSANFPVSSDAFQKTNKSTSTYAATNVFVSKLSANGSDLVYSTYLGGGGNEFQGDQGSGIAVDPECSAYVTGQTGSANFPTTSGVLEPKTLAALYSWSSFVSKLNPAGSALSYSTYLGGSNIPNGEGDYGYGIQVDAAGQAYITGMTQSTTFPITSSTAYQTTNKETGGSGNAYLTELNPAGSALVYSSYLGGSGTDGKGDTASAVALDIAGNAYIVGSTYSQTFPVTTGAYQQKSAGTVNQNGITANVFIAKFGIGSGAVLSPTTTTVTADANPSSANVKTTFTAYVSQGTACGFPATGTVAFVIDGGAPIKVTLDDTGHASYSITTLTVGKHTVVVTYSGDMKYKTSASGTYTETIDAAPTKVANVSGSGQTAVYGATFAKPLVVSVTDATGGVAPGVPVTFSGTGLKFASATVMTNASGQASVTVIAAGTGALTATATASGVSAPVTFALTGTKAALTFTAVNKSVPYNQTTTPFTYTVTGYENGDTAATAYTGVLSETSTGTKGSPVGTYPIVIGVGTLKSTNYTFKFVNGVLTITSLGTAKTPTFSPAAGTYTGPQKVTLSSATSGAVIYYTTTGATPTASSTKYTAPIAVNATETIKCIAVAPGYVNSPVGSGTFTLKVATPTFTPGAGSYTAAQSVKIATTTGGAVIYYTVNGSTPTTASTRYTGAIAVKATETIKAIGVEAGYTTSAVGSAAYTIKAAAVSDVRGVGAVGGAGPAVKRAPIYTAIPYFSPGAGTYAAAQSVRIGDTTAGAVMYYTTNGSTPTTAATRYVGPIAIGSTETLKAIAIAPNYDQSGLASGVYTIR